MASSSTATAVSSISKKQDTVIWEIQNAREAAKLALLMEKPIASISFDVGEIVSKHTLKTKII